MKCHPDRALLRLNIRTFEDQVRDRLLRSSVSWKRERPPRVPRSRPNSRYSSKYPLTRDDGAATQKLAAAFTRRFGVERVQELAGPFSASEDFSLFAAAWDVPAVFWVVGGIDPDTYQGAEKAGKTDELPVNSLPRLRARDRTDPARRHRGNAGSRRCVARQGRARRPEPGFQAWDNLNESWSKPMNWKAPGRR